MSTASIRLRHAAARAVVILTLALTGLATAQLDQSTSAAPAGGAVKIPSLDRAREIGHAILASQARARHQVEAEIQPLLDALSETREALRLYALEFDLSVQPPVGVGGPAGASGRAAATEDAALSAQRRAARRQAAQDALTALRQRREALAIAVADRAAGPSAARAAANPAEPPADAAAPAVHPEVVERWEADADAVLAGAAAGDADTPAAVRRLLQRLDARPPRRPTPPRQPAVVYRALPFTIEAGNR